MPLSLGAELVIMWLQANNLTNLTGDRCCPHFCPLLKCRMMRAQFIHLITSFIHVHVHNIFEEVPMGYGNVV